MSGSTVVGMLKSIFVKNFVAKVISAAVGAVSLYLVDVGLLDGDAADTLANALMQVVLSMLNLIS